MIHANTLLSRIREQMPERQNRKLLIYVHVPFCSSRCLFCDWVKDVPPHELRAGEELQAKYVDALCAQIHAVGPGLMALGYEPAHVYWGGGTPTRLGSSGIARIAECLRRVFDLSRCESYTVEASPHTLSPEKLATLRACGVNRISLGVQSFQDLELQRIGRHHRAEECRRALAEIRAAGITNVSVDLVAGLPGQTQDSFRESLRECLRHEVPHVSLYMCRTTPGTPLWKLVRSGALRAATPAAMFAHYEIARTLLGQAGMSEYFLGYFAKGPQARCPSDEYFFSLEGDYIGFGNGARSLVGRHHVENPQAHVERFLESPAVFEKFHPISRDSQNWEPYFHPTLWTSMGLLYERFADMLGFRFAEVRQSPTVRRLIAAYENQGAVFRETAERLAITPETRMAAYLRVMAAEA